MSTTLTYGRKVPATGERGSVWFPILEDNIALDDSHDHDGSDSAAIPTKNLSKGTSTIASGSWAATSGNPGTYDQTISLPSGYLMATLAPSFYTSAGDQIYPTIEKVTTTSYKIYINDNTLTLTAVYA